MGGALRREGKRRKREMERVGHPSGHTGAVSGWSRLCLLLSRAPCTSVASFRGCMSTCPTHQPQCSTCVCPAASLPRSPNRSISPRAPPPGCFSVGRPSVMESPLPIPALSSHLGVMCGLSSPSLPGSRSSPGCFPHSCLYSSPPAASHPQALSVSLRLCSWAVSSHCSPRSPQSTSHPWSIPDPFLIGALRPLSAVLFHDKDKAT